MIELFVAAGPFKPLLLLSPLILALLVAGWYLRWITLDDHGKAELLFWTAIAVSVVVFLLMSWVAVQTSTWYFFAAGCLSLLGIALVFELPAMKRLDKNTTDEYLDSVQMKELEGLTRLVGMPDGEYNVEGANVTKRTSEDGEVSLQVTRKSAIVKLDMTIDLRD